MAMDTTSFMFLVGVHVALLLTAAGNSAAENEVLEFKHQNSVKEEQCDLFNGEWIYDPSSGRSYTEECEILAWKIFLECKENGRPDDSYQHWRWKPYGCDLPSFDPQKFLSRMRNKSFGGIGDSITGNQLQSLLCMLSQVETPTVVSRSGTLSEKWQFPTYKWLFPTYNFTVESISSPMLLKVDSWENPMNYTIHLDILDDTWTSKYHGYDYVLVGDGAWFDKTMYMVEGDIFVGCHGCQTNSLPKFGKYYIFRKALNQAFRFMTAASDDQKPRVVIFRTQAPDHFEHGHWDEGGFCNRTLPFSSVADIPDDLTNYEDNKLMDIVINEEFAKAVATKSNSKTQFQLLDIYSLSLLRPDGHPNVYREKGKSNDCLHWCLPGVPDTWNEILMAMLWPDNDMKESH